MVPMPTCRSFLYMRRSFVENDRSTPRCWSATGTKIDQKWVPLAWGRAASTSCLHCLVHRIEAQSQRKLHDRISLSSRCCAWSCSTTSVTSLTRRSTRTTDTRPSWYWRSTANDQQVAFTSLFCNGDLSLSLCQAMTNITIDGEPTDNTKWDEDELVEHSQTLD